MLPAAARVRSRTDHRVVAATGRRARRGSLLVSTASPAACGATRTRGGVIVGRRIGSAVVRNRVRRRIRELLRSRLPQLPAGALVVVRALPGAAAADYAQLGSWLDAGLASTRPNAAGHG